MEQSLFWEANSFSASQEIPRILWKTKLLQHSQEPATGSHSEVTSIKSMPLPTLYFVKMHFNIVLHVVSFAQVPLPKPCMRPSFPQYVPHAPPISFLILSPE